MHFHRLFIGVWLGALVAAAPAQQDHAPRLDVEIGNTALSVPRDYVISWNSRGKPHPNSRERLWVAFSGPGFERLGFGWAGGRTWEGVARQREELRSRGEDIVELVLTPDDGHPILWNRDSLERRCREFRGRFDDSTLGSLSGFSCLLADNVGKRYFPVHARSMDGVLVCNLSDKPCELQARGLSDKMLRTIPYIEQSQVWSAAQRLDAAESFIRERIERR